MGSEQQIKTKFEISWLTEDVVYCKYNDNVEIGLNDVKQVLELQVELGVNESVKRIVHAGRHTTITQEAREYIEQHKPRVKAEAFVLFGLAQKILFQFYTTARKNDNPIKPFNSLDSARRWIDRV